MTPPAEGALTSLLDWGFPASAGWCRLGPSGPEVAATVGATGREFPWASVTKIVTALAVWVAVEEGTVSWDDPAGPPGATLRHLLAHASGLSPDSDAVLAPPGRRRIYSNRGFEVAAGHLSRAAGMPFERYARQAVMEPLGMHATRLEGSPAAGCRGPLVDLLALARELLAPTIVSPATVFEATTTVFPGLAGVLPGFGHQPDNAWGSGMEVRDHKAPHWTGELNSPATFGHFGRSGSLLWVDPSVGRALVSLSERPFGPWSVDAWPRLSDAVVRA